MQSSQCNDPINEYTSITESSECNDPINEYTNIIVIDKIRPKIFERQQYNHGDCLYFRMNADK